MKFGGNAMVDDALKRDFAADVVTLLRAGIRPVVVHGGGPQISAALQRAGIPTEFRGGYRFTSTAAIQVVHDVLAERGQRGADRADQRARRLRQGRVRGARVACSPAAAAAWWSTGGRSTSATSATSTRSTRRRSWRCWMPAASRSSRRSPRTARTPATVLNVNADAAASAVAIALRASWLLVLTDVAGLYRDWPNRDSLVSRIDTAGTRGAAAHGRHPA